MYKLCLQANHSHTEQTGNVEQGDRHALVRQRLGWKPPEEAEWQPYGTNGKIFFVLSIVINIKYFSRSILFSRLLSLLFVLLSRIYLYRLLHSILLLAQCFKSQVSVTLSYPRVPLPFFPSLSIPHSLAVSARVVASRHI